MDNDNKTIIVNATGTTTGGGLTILQQFLENLPLYDTVNDYYVFVGTDDVNKYHGANIHIVNGIYRRKWIGRIWWDNIGIGQWLKKHRLKPDLVISLQNTGIKLGRDINQMIYYNQSIPFFDYKWRLLNKSERIFWIYKNIYPYFVRKHIYEKTKFIVPANWMIEKALQRFRIKKEQVCSIRSDVRLIDNGDLNENLDKYSFFYPATALKYKNHDVIIEALNIIKRENPKLYNKIIVTFTCSRDELSKYLDTELERARFTGYLQYEEMLAQYKKHGTLLFPSYLESFAIPLIEAAHFGMEILAVDLQYARETIAGYDGVRFLEYNNARVWADAIVNIVESDGKRFASKDTQRSESWKNFFDLIKDQIY